MHTTLIDSLIEPFTEFLTVEAAEKVASLRANEELQRYVDELADKANRGVLTDEERHDYDRILAAFHFVTLVQAKARRIISQ